MVAISRIQTHLLIHGLSNPPSEQISCNADITLKNNNGRIILKKIGFESQTAYELIINDPGAFGFGDGNESEGIRDFLLASNLALKESVMATKRVSVEKLSTEYENPGTVSRIETTEAGQKITIEESVTFKDSIHITTGLAEDLDVVEVMNNLSDIRKVDRTLRKSMGAQHLQMAKSLLSFESAIASHDRLAIFRNLYSALELAANSNGANRDGPNLVLEISRVTGVPQADAAAWRNLNNRIKHSDRTAKESMEFVQSMKDLPSFILPMRSAAKSLILSSLVVLS